MQKSVIEGCFFSIPKPFTANVFFRVKIFELGLNTRIFNSILIRTNILINGMYNTIECISTCTISTNFSLQIVYRIIENLFWHRSSSMNCFYLLFSQKKYNIDMERETWRCFKEILYFCLIMHTVNKVHYHHLMIREVFVLTYL